mgnify:CR=1 FL=1
MLQAVKERGKNLEFASESLQDDKEVVMEALKQDGEALFLLFSSNIFAKQPEKAERKTNDLLDEGDFLWYAIIVIKYLFWQRKGG